jgi:hypothetical protein
MRTARPVAVQKTDDDGRTNLIFMPFLRQLLDEVTQAGGVTTAAASDRRALLAPTRCLRSREWILEQLYVLHPLWGTPPDGVVAKCPSSHEGSLRPWNSTVDPVSGARSTATGARRIASTSGTRRHQSAQISGLARRHCVTPWWLSTPCRSAPRRAAARAREAARSSRSGRVSCRCRHRASKARHCCRQPMAGTASFPTAGQESVLEMRSGWTWAAVVASPRPASEDRSLRRAMHVGAFSSCLFCSVVVSSNRRGGIRWFGKATSIVHRDQGSEA